MRYEWIDYAKGVGILLVVLGHIIRGLLEAGILNSDFFLFLDNIIYSFHMPLFMLLSGVFVISSIGKRSGLQFLMSKLDTIFYPYLLWMVLQGGVEFLLSGYTNGSVSLVDVFSLWFPRAQFWFLYVLFIFMIFVCVVRVNFGSWTLPILLFISLVIYFILASEDIRVISLISRFLVFFTIGMVFGRYLSKVSGYLSSLPVFFSLFFMCFLSQYFFNIVFDLKYYDYTLFAFLNSFLSVVTVLSACINLTKHNFFMGFCMLGQASMLIYLGHILSASGLRIILQKYFGIDDAVTHIIGGILFGILPWYVIYVMAKRYKILRYLYEVSFFSEILMRVKRGSS